MGQTFGQAFGQLIRAKRGQEGLTQKALAILAFDDESKVRRINDIETGAVHRPHAKTVDALAVALGIRDDELARCRDNGMFAADEEAGIGLSRQLMENLALRFNHENPNAPDIDLFKYLQEKANELKILQDRLKLLDGLTATIHNQIAAANQAIESGNLEEADEILAAAEEIQQSERTLNEIETQSQIRFARGDTALFAGKSSTAAEHYLRAAEYYFGFDKKKMTSMLEQSAAQIYEYERRTLSPNFEHAIGLARKALDFISASDDKETWVRANYRFAMLQQVQAHATDDTQLYDDAITTANNALAKADADIENEDYSNLKILLGNCYINRSEARAETSISDLESAISVFEEATQDPRVDNAQYHSYLQSSLSAAYSRLSRINENEVAANYAKKAKRALRRAIEISSQEGQVDLWAACQLNLGNELAEAAQEAEATQPEKAIFLRIQGIAALGACLEAYPETLLHPHTRRAQFSLGRILLDQARLIRDSRRELYLTRSIHAYEFVLAMSDDDISYAPDAKYSIGLAFNLHAEIADLDTAISDLEKALEYFELARPGYEVSGREPNLQKLNHATSEVNSRLKTLREKADQK